MSRPISRPPALMLSLGGAADADTSAEHIASPSTIATVSKKRESQRSAGALAQINNFVQRAGMTEREANGVLGYSAGNIQHWRKTGTAPVVAGLAAECLTRRLGASGSTAPASDRVFVFRLSATAADVDAVLLLLAKFGVKAKEL